MKNIKPKKLKKGDTIGILAVSGKINDYSRIERSKNFFEELGYNVVISETCKSSHRYLAGNNTEECIDELHNFFANNSIDAILCARGGFGTIKLLEKINWDIIKDNPKIFAGYSDITILLNMIYKKTDLITFHSAMPYGDFSENIENYTKDSFIQCLNGTKKEYNAENFLTFKEGKTIGKLWGGNLSTLVSLCGTDFVPNEDLILFLEDLNEPTYKIEKMLIQLFNIEKIRKNVKGIAFGEFKDVNDSELLNEIFTETIQKLNIPSCNGFKITHNKVKETIPIGVKAELDSKKGKLKLIEEYTK